MMKLNIRLNIKDLPKRKVYWRGGPYSEYDAQSSEIWKSFSDFVTKGVPPTQAMMEILDKHDWASQTAERSTAIKRVEPSKSAWGAIGTIPFDWNPSNEYSFGTMEVLIW